MTFERHAQGVFSVRRRSAIPGFGLTLGVTALYLALIVVIPLGGLVGSSASGLGLTRNSSHIATQPRVAARARSLVRRRARGRRHRSALIGAPIAWALARYRFPGQRLFDAAIDLPFALPTAVAGIALSTLYAPNGWFGAPLATLGIKIAFTPLGIFVALVFVGLPFVVRTLQPVIAELETRARRSLGDARRDAVSRHFGA